MRERRGSHERMTITDVIKNLERHKQDYPKDAAWADSRIAYWESQRSHRNKGNGQFAKAGGAK